MGGCVNVIDNEYNEKGDYNDNDEGGVSYRSLLAAVQLPIVTKDLNLEKENWDLEISESWIYIIGKHSWSPFSKIGYKSPVNVEPHPPPSKLNKNPLFKS